MIPANINSLGIDVPPSCFDETSGNFGTRMEDVITVGGQPAWAAALEARADELFPDANLTAVQIAARAQFSGTCIGCHHRPDEPQYRDLGQGLTLPVVTVLPEETPDDVDFTQVNNLREEPCAPYGADAAQDCFKLSPVLGEIFLPHRKNVLELLAHASRDFQAARAWPDFYPRHRRYPERPHPLSAGALSHRRR